MRATSCELVALGCLMGLTACAGTTAKVRPGVPVQAEPGYCFLLTQFKQGGQRVNRSDALHRLANNEKSGSAATLGQALDIGSRILGVAGGVTLGLGIGAKARDSEMSQGTSTGLIIGGAAAVAVGMVMCAVGEGQYVKAAELYSEQPSTWSAEEEREEESEGKAGTATKQVDDRAYETEESSK